MISIKDKDTLRWILKSAKGMLIPAVILTLMRTATTLLGVVFSLSSKYVVDSAVSADLNGLKTAAFVLVAIVVSQILIRLLGQGFETTITAKLNMNMRNRLFSTILCRDYTAESSYHSGDLLTRLSNDTSIISSGIVSLVPNVIALIAGLIYALYTLLKLDRNFALILLTGGIILILAISAFRGIMKALNKRVLESEGKVRSFFQESLGSILMVKVFGIENTVSNSADTLLKHNLRDQLKLRNLSIFAMSGLSFIFSLGTLYALISGAYRIYTGAMTFGTLTAVLQLVSQIQAPFANLSGIIPKFYAILASSERIIEIENLPGDDLSEEPLNPRQDYESLTEISFTDISFGYKEDIIFDKASLTIDKGDFAVIGGISGIGKSTLIKLLLGVINPQSGDITLNLGNRQTKAGKHTRPLFSYVPQGNLLLSGTIREAVSMVNPTATDKEIMQAAKISCADEFIENLPQGLDTYIGEKGFGLSEGQIQRLAVTRAILSDAPIILLDEATSALDEETERQLLENIKAMENKTCIIISHKAAAFKVCNKKIYIANKKIIKR